MAQYQELNDEEWLRAEYIEKGRSQSDIAEEVGCSQGAVSHAANRMGLEKGQEQYPELNDPKWLREKHHNENLSLSEIADMLGCTRSAVGYGMRRNDIEVRQNSVVNELDTPLSDRDTQIIEGELLGDGCIPKPHGKAGAMFTYGTSRECYRDWLCDWFADCGYEVRSYQYVQGADRDGWSETTTYRFETHTYFSLMDLRKRWYPDGEKIVPKGFELSPLSLRHWFIGDGSYPDGSDQLILYTDGFDDRSVEYLQSELGAVGIDSIINHRNSILVNKQDSRERFFEYMEPLPQELGHVYGYKWP